jgi:dTMP kinase
MERKGMFVVVEGFDGAGKSTFCWRLEKTFKQQGLDVVLCRQPGGTPLAEQIRSYLKDTSVKETIHPLSEYLMMSAARHQLWMEVIKPALDQNKVVICDRHLASSFAYQNHAMDEVDQSVASLPDYTVWLDVDFTVAMTRLRGRAEDCRIEQRGSEYLKAVHERYRQAWDHLPHNRRLRVRSNDFDSREYQEDCLAAANTILSEVKNIRLVSASEFERQVAEVEGIRIIIKQDGTIPLMSYPYTKQLTPDIEASKRRISSVLQNIPYLVVPRGDSQVFLATDGTPWN